MTSSKEHHCTWRDDFWELPNLPSMVIVSIETWRFKMQSQYSFTYSNTSCKEREGYCTVTEPVKPTNLSSLGQLLSVNKILLCTPLAGCPVCQLAGCDPKASFLPYREIFVALQVSFAHVS